MDTNRISVDIECHDHRLLKSYCASIGVTVKKFVLDAVICQLEEKLKQRDSKEKEKKNGGA